MGLSTSYPPYSQATETREGFPVFYLVIWVFYLVFSPFYIFPRGMPQPADFLLVLGIAAMIGTEYRRMEMRVKPVYLLGGLFVILTICINLVNYVFYPNVRFLLTMLYYPYNFLIFLFVTWMFSKRPDVLIKTSLAALAISLPIQIMAVFVMDSGHQGARATAGFDNPNQLAYWALLTATMVVFLRRLEGHLRPTDYILLGMAMFLQALALSKAGIIASTVFIFLLLLSPLVNAPARFIGSIPVVILAIFLIFQPQSLFRAYEYMDVLEHVVQRIEGIGSEADDDPEVRGYYRLNQFPFYTLFGSGEGAFERFDPSGRELHSGIATIIFSYGILGATLFFSFLGLILNRQPWYYMLLFVPIILFGLPHQNFRFSHFWVMLGINYGLLLYVQMRHRQNQQRLGP